MLTHSRLKELLNYEPDTGVFTWKVDRTGHTKSGDIAGGINNYGYRYIKIDGKKYGAHRLAWFYVFEQFPPDYIDHINGKTDDNRIENLRPCTNSENQQNRAGFYGVCWIKGRRRWRSQIKINGKRKVIGQFFSKDDAYAAYCAAKKEIHLFQPTPRT